MRGNSLRFLKPSVFIKTFLVFCAIFAAMLSISCKQLASFEPSVDGARVVVSKTFSAPTDLTATQGRKQKISLEWTPVSGAKYYEIHSAKSATAEFEKIYETDKNSFDDKVGAGSTRYYKVCAVKSNDTKSAFSTIVKGTSLAQPVISGGTITESTATIFWFMENARGINEDNYEEFLKFEVFCEGGSDTLSQTFDAKEMSSYECKFDNLASSTEYTFYVVAYTTKDQQSTEQTPRVNKNTLTSYTPLAPTFNASEGTSAEGIWLNITLPEMVKVNTVTNSSQNEAVDESYPLYFKVFRRIVDTGSYDEVCSLYYNGTEFTTDPVEYQKDGAPYKAGETGAWFDNDTNLRGGVKYEYKIISYSDTAGYDTVVCPEGTKNNSTSTPDDDDKLFKKAVGWKCARPSFKVKFDEDGGRTLSADETKVVSVSFGFSAEWKDLGKAGEYKFAIKQNRKPLKASDSSAGDDTWLKNEKNESEFFDTLEEINSYYKVKFGSESGLTSDDEGLYIYTLYIVSKDVGEIGEALGVEGKELCHTGAIDKILVTKSVNLPKPGFTVEGGYTNKVVLTVSNLEPNVTYKVTRTKILNDGNPTNDIEEITLPVNEDDVVKKSYTYDDSRNMQDNCRYYYILKATDKNGGYSLSESREAETLGTPVVSFNREALSYDSITISFYGVLAAEKYVVQFGASGNGSGFGGGATFEITKNGDEWVGSSSGDATAKVDFAANKFTVTINKPEGYDDATKAGDTAELTVTAHSSNDNARSNTEQVNVVGPALLGATVNTFAEAKEDSISVTWKAVEGAKGYLIRRVMYSDAAMTKPAEGSGVTYYCEGEKITYEGVDTGGRGRVTISKSGDSGKEIFTLTDSYMESTTEDADLQVYQEAQAKIAWGLPFRYVVLPVLNKKDFDFNNLELAEGGKVAYKNLAPTAATATWGYGLNVHAKKSESATTQNVTWEKPFYGDEKLTPKVYRRKFANNDKNEWEAVDSIIKEFGAEKKPGIDYSPSGEDRYCAWEYVVKYRKEPSDKIAPSYVEWLKDSEHDETVYDYGSATKEKLNKGYLLAMDYSAKYGGDGTSKGHDYYYSEDVTITPWYYNDRTLGPDKVELKVCSFDLADGWQSVGMLDPEITGFTEKKTLTDTTVSDVNLGTIKLKPTGISGGTKSTTDGPLKILRSAKHYYGLDLSRGGNEGFDCKDYEEYAYRQITDEELVRAATLAMSVGIKHSMPNDGWTRTNDPSNSWTGSSGSVTTRWYAREWEWGQGEHHIHTTEFVKFITYLTCKSGDNVSSFLQIDGEIQGKIKGSIASSRPPQYYSGTITVKNILTNEGGITIKFNDAKKDSTKEIELTRNGNSLNFGNITPLPYEGQGNNGFLNDSAEWQ